MADNFERLRTPENTKFVDHLVKNATADTVNMLDNVECPCIKTLILERCSSEEIQGYIKIASMFAQVYQHSLVNQCLTHTNKAVNDMNRAAFAFCLSSVDHSLVEMARRENEFNLGENKNDDTN